MSWPHLARQVEATIAQATGRSYRIPFDALDEDSLREILRLLRDLEDARRSAVQWAAREPWRHG